MPPVPPVRDAYCSYCGTKFAAPLVSPRTCAGCATPLWSNPIPVCVVVVPVEDDGRTGVLVIRRAVPPHVGRLALPGGFLEDHETWQHGAAREVREETGASIDPAALAPLSFASSVPRHNRLLLFSLAPPLAVSALPPFHADAETLERGLVFGPGGLDDVFAFPLHVEAIARFFASRGAHGPHDFAAR